MISHDDEVLRDFPEEALAPQAHIGTDPMDDKDIHVSQTTEVMQ